MLMGAKRFLLRIAVDLINYNTVSESWEPFIHKICFFS